MKTFNSMTALQVDPAVSEAVYNYFQGVVDATKEYSDEPDEVGKDFAMYLGGEVKLVETFEDLKLVPTLEDSKLPVELRIPELEGWASIVETPSVFDVVITLSDGTVNLFIASNNAGGTTYLVPADIALQCPNIELSKKLSGF